MSIPDPIWPDRSLRENPFLKDYFAEQDRQNEPQKTIQDQNSNISSDNKIKAEERPSRQRDSDPVSHERDLYHDNERGHDNGNNPFIRSDTSQSNGLEAKIVEMAFDPFDETWDVDRIARVLILANEFQKDEEERALRREQNQVSEGASLDAKQKVFEYASDPLGDFGSLDPNRLKRVEALVNVIPKENHLIQSESSKLEPLPNQVKIHDNGSFQNESDIRDKILLHQEKIGLVKKGIQKVEKFIEKHIPQADLNQFHGKDSKQYVKFQNDRENQKVQNFENTIRGINDYFVRNIDAFLGFVPGLNHSSQDFCDRHLMGRKGGGLENSLYYWTGTATGVAAELCLLKGASAAANIGRIALQKAGNSMARAGLQAAVHAKLTTGAIGKGVASYLPRASGGSAAVVHQSATVLNYAEAGILRVAEYTAQVIKNSPEVVKRAPEVAKFLQNPVANAWDFMRGVASLSKGLHVFEKLSPQTSVIPEIDSVANQAISQAALRETEAQAIVEDLGAVLDNLDDPTSAFKAYGEFAYRQEMRQFVQDMNCPQEAVSHVMRKLPRRTHFATDTIDETIKNILIAEDNIRYCDKYIKDPWVREKLLQLLMPLENHHVYTDKSVVSGVTKGFKKIFDKYGLNLNEHWNFLLIPHRGRHSPKYHKWCYDNLVAADNIVQSQIGLSIEQQKELLLKLIQKEVIMPLRENPLLPMYKWYDFWQNDKLQADSMKSSSTKEETTILQP